jgi:hypothetical protein
MEKDSIGSSNNEATDAETAAILDSGFSSKASSATSTLLQKVGNKRAEEKRASFFKCKVHILKRVRLVFPKLHVLIPSFQSLNGDFPSPFEPSVSVNVDDFLHNASNSELETMLRKVKYG